MTDSKVVEIHFRTVSPTDIPACYEIEQASYPHDEAASKSALQYRQHHAAPYFWCAVISSRVVVVSSEEEDHHHHHDTNNHHDKDDVEEEILVGYICSTRCWEFTHESLCTHDTSGPLLAIHSIVVSEKYRGQGIARAMLQDYITAISARNDGIEKLVLMAKKELLGFYVQCGFTVTNVSPIVHGQDVWYNCELSLDKTRSKDNNTEHSYWVLDTFTEKGGSGNPASVVLLPLSYNNNVDDDDDDANDNNTNWMKLVAKEFNLSETAFIWPSTTTTAVGNLKQGENGVTIDHKDDDDDEEDVQGGGCGSSGGCGGGSGEVVNYRIRYFTCNGTEVDLCGHATLASAAVLFQTRKLKNDATIVFEANKDTLSVSLEGKNTNWIRNSPIKLKMNFPKKLLYEITTSADRSAVLGMLKMAFSMDFDAENILYLGLDQDGGDVLIELTRDHFFQVGYDNIHYSALMQWDGYSRGVILCCRENNHYPVKNEEEEKDDCGVVGPVVDFLSRFFGPKAGINEDPVTGSAHCTLGPYFGAKLHKTILVGKQMSERGGTVTCVLEEDRVSIIGTAITTMTGSLHMASSTCN